MNDRERRWVIVGAGGMLGGDLLSVLDDRDVRAFTRNELDIRDEDAVANAVSNADVVVNCAAYTKVDDAEADEETAYDINALGVAVLARGCADAGARLLHISTDYVFAGDQHRPYAEDETPDPRTAYGRTKVAGEREIQRWIPDSSWILRTAWLYGSHGPNFVSTMKRLEAERETVEVVDDQRGQPTWTRDLAERIRLTVEHELPFGVYHATNSGTATWFELAREVFTLLGADPERVTPTTTNKFPRPAPRPSYSVLGHDRWARVGEQPMRPWETALKAAAGEVLGVDVTS